MQLKKLLTVITKIFLGCFIVAYPFIVFYALKQNVAVKFIGLILLMMIIFSFLRNRNKFIFIVSLAFAFLVIFFNQEIFLKLYPVLMNASICAIFALSLRKTPLITQFAQKMQQEPLNTDAVIYTRKATQAWAIFMFLNTIVSLMTVFMTNEIWALYNGFISYILIGTMMLAEYIVRKGRKKMFTQINRLFIENTELNRIVFYNADKPVYFHDYMNDVAKYANLFQTIENDNVVIYIPDNLYLFYVCFMAAFQADKDVILPAVFTEQNSKPLLDTTNILITDKFDSFGDFNIVNLDCENNTNWQFKDINDRFLYFFTSGSTGTPKRIKKQFKMLAAEVAFHGQNQKHLIEQKPVAISSVAPYHIYGLLWRFLFPLANGIVSDLDIVFTPEELQNKQSLYDKVLFATTPSFLDGITRYQNQYYFKNNCIGIYSSGSLLDTKTSTNAYQMFGVSPYEIFGSTETGGVASRQQINGQEWTIFAPVNVSLTENNELLIESDFSCENPYLMSDIVEKTSDHTFLLKGRGDRMVKIAEERVSLPEMEEKLCEYEYIEKSYVAPLTTKDRTIICTAITLTDSGKEYIIKNGRHQFITELKQHLLNFFPNVVLPRKIRIVNTIPVNMQGKYIKSDILSMFESNVAEPIMQNITKTDSLFAADLTFLKDSTYFNGHFPGHPILPGVIQMHFVMMFIKQFFNMPANDYHILKLKFSDLILPDTPVHFELNKISDNEFTFEYTDYSKGKIVIKG